MQVSPLLGQEWPELAASVSAAIDLDATARCSGALVRRRGVRSAEGLLRLALAYGPGRLSLRSAAAWAGLVGLAALSDTALMNRLRHAAAWLGEVAGALLRRRLGLPSTPGPLAGRRLRIADASTIVAPGDRPAWGRGLRPHRMAAGRGGTRGPLLRPSTGPAPPAGCRGRLRRPHRVDAPATARQRRRAAGLGPDLRPTGCRRGRGHGGPRGYLRQGWQVAWQGNFPGPARRAPPSASRSCARGQSPAPAAEPLPRGPATPADNGARDRLLDARHLPAR